MVLLFIILIELNRIYYANFYYANIKLLKIV